MHERRLPEWLRHPPTPDIKGFAILAGLEAVTRGILLSVFPLVMYQALGQASLVSAVYFIVGFVSLTAGLMVPWLIRFVPRRWVYTTGALFYVLGATLAIEGGQYGAVGALAANTVGTVSTFVCFNAYVLDHISRVRLGKMETSRMFYSAIGWTFGPISGVTLHAWWAPAPFLLSASAAMVMLAVFWYLRLGNGKLITRASAPPPNPLAFLGRFFRQPRLVAGWLFAVIRSCGWWIYIVYLPIYAIESGLSPKLGGWAASFTNAALFAAPLMLIWVRRRPLRQAVLTGFGVTGGLFLAATLMAGYPPVTVGLLMTASVFLILLDICGGLPFLMAVKPSERTEMSAIYSSFRDVSGILTPGIAWVVLLAAPVSGVFAAGGVAMFIAFAIATRLHPRLGQERIPAMRAAQDAL
ncbi:MFS transporter [Seohaeicola zhoushanensis]|uniref:MFS transporter n=1 Tax=Seohaeicola zhoushanensis TaxID=1569283 RepID=A0A8J3M6P4_9RHOB|nr:MFS transporter [Seohaeicola zhoushanensis]GHF48692.1 MFS transporter [Seohaeicola zhoushanensis]